MADKNKVNNSMPLLGKILAYPTLVISLIIGILLTVSAYCSLLPPVGEWPLLSLSGLAFPFLFTANLAFLLLWLLTTRKFAILPLFFLIITAIPTFRYCPIHHHRAMETEPDLTLVSYNTQGFGNRVNHDNSVNNDVFQYSTAMGADIICYQESLSPIVLDRRKEDSRILELYPHCISESAYGLACLSKYPVLSHEIIEFDGITSNRCMILKIQFGTDTITVFNCHFQSNHLDPGDFEVTSQDDAIEGGKRMLRKLLNSTSLRARQAETIAEMAKNTTGPVIVAGDFNDTPLSYVHRLFDRYFTDCYAKAGTGIGHSYNRHYLYYRIDHVFCSSHFTPVSCRIDRGCNQSDHYPIVTEFVCNFKR